ncbi:Zn-dependent exopeptidase [Biscogniauxia mediterranea]|nr:Zn-dependent exopeptidase [Biscogniauxia mediterranea]
MKLFRLAILLYSSSQILAYEVQKPLQASSGISSAGAPTYRDDLVSLHKHLIEISSVTYTEHEVGNFLIDYLTARGFAAEPQALPPTQTNDGEKARFNVLAWPGSDQHPEPKVLVSSHIDTVPPFIPYSRTDGALTSDTLIAGRGSVDAKASVAAQITAVIALLDEGAIDPADVMLAFVVGEERAGDGMRHFSDSVAARDPPIRFRAAIFGEPTEGRLACGHKGFFGCEVTAHGHAGHSGYPWLGKSATEVLMRVLVDILDADLGSSEEFGNTTINVGTIQGGVAANVIPETAVAQIAGRVAIGPEAEGGRIVAERVQAILKSADEEAFEVECKNGYGVVKCDCDVEGFETITVNYGTDVPNFKGNHTRYLYGPGSILVAHGPDEAIKLKDLETAVEDYKKLILHVLQD